MHAHIYIHTYAPVSPNVIAMATHDSPTVIFFSRMTSLMIWEVELVALHCRYICWEKWGNHTHSSKTTLLPWSPLPEGGSLAPSLPSFPGPPYLGVQRGAPWLHHYPPSLVPLTWVSRGGLPDSITTLLPWSPLPGCPEGGSLTPSLPSFPGPPYLGVQRGAP